MSIANAYANPCRPPPLYSNRWPNEPTQQSSEWGLPQSVEHQNRWQLSSYFTPIARLLIDEVSAATQTSPIIASTIFLSAAASAIHNLYDVQRPNCPPTPTSLFTLAIKKSGGRKTTVLNVFLKEHFQFQRALYREQTDDAEFEASNLVWKAKIKASEALARKHADDDEKLDSITEDLVTILRGKPAKRKLASNVIIKDSTKQALSYSTFENSPSVVLVSDEATTFFKTFSNDFTIFNQGYDGADIKVDRKTTPSFFVEQPRIGLILATQPKPFKKVVEEKGLDLIEIGLLPRMLVSLCTDNLATQINPQLISSVARENYYAWIRNMLSLHNEKLKVGDLSRTVLTFTPEAESQWERTKNWLYEAAQTNGPLSNIQEYVARCAEHIARVSANLHVVENRDGTSISIDTVISATQIVRWYAMEFQRLFGDISMPEYERDAKSIINFLWARYQATGIAHSNVRFLTQYTWGGRGLRTSSSRIFAAIERLESLGILHRQNFGRSCNVVLNPGFIHQQINQPSRLFQYGS